MHISTTRRGRGVLITAVVTLSAGLLALAVPAQAVAKTPAAASIMSRVPRAHLHAGPAEAGTAATDPQRAKPASPPLVSNMTYHGGPVVHHPRVYLVFWGPQWMPDPVRAGSYTIAYFQGLGLPSDTWSTITSQYTDTTGTGPTFGTAVFAGSVIDMTPPPPVANAAQIAAEAVAGATYFNAFGTDVQIFVMSPPGTHPAGFPATGFCAYHASTTDSQGRFVAYTNMPFVLDGGPPCGAGTVQGPLDGFSIYGGHEYTETLTDPALNAWYDTSLTGEIGDKCQNAPYFAQALATGLFAQQQVWSNAINGCARST